MLHFLKLTLDDIKKVQGYFSYSTNRICDNTVGGTFMWRDFFSMEYALFNDTVIFKVKLVYHDGITAFSVPLGNDARGSVQEVEKYCKSLGIPVVFCTVTKDDVKLLEDCFGEVRLSQEVNWSDYVYKAGDLINLTGRKFNGQRNYINNFKKTYQSYSFEEITKNNIDEIKEFNRLFNLKTSKNNDIFIEERTKTLEVLDNYDIYGLIGGLLRVNGVVAAFSIGEICGNVLHIHIEKADLRYRGAYQVIVNEFAKHYASKDIEFLNREEDVGDEGLRISKMSYHPCDIIEKYIAEVK